MILGIVIIVQTQIILKCNQSELYALFFDFTKYTAKITFNPCLTIDHVTLKKICFNANPYFFILD
jgi:hypothetical protein